jgi:hypothetical protein
VVFKFVGPELITDEYILCLAESMNLITVKFVTCKFVDFNIKFVGFDEV